MRKGSNERSIHPVTLLGILNLTEDSFSDGGRYLEAEAAIAHGRELIAAGADVLDLGAASSHPDSRSVSAEEEIRRLEPVVRALHDEGRSLSIDSWQPAVQEFAISRGVDFLNDIRGFADPDLYPTLARARCRLVIMYSVLGGERADRQHTDPERVYADLLEFFAERVAALESAGVSRRRMLLDPGMGFFLGSNPETSLFVLRKLKELQERFVLPIFVSVSRKSFLGALTDRAVAERGPATLAAELFAARRGAAYIRTHEPGPLRDALVIQTHLES